jgi:DmsE family decaheme c-type cytochrome
MLKTRMRKADLCYTCHQDKEGPFMFEHPPVQEDCSLCHTPHGSVADNLLTASEPTLCLQCHDFHFHTGYRASESDVVDVGGIERENPFGIEGFQIAYSTNCTQCHARIHGSDTPSQTPTNYGKGLTQ